MTNPLKHTIAECVTCHTVRTIVAYGQCSSCYQRSLRGVPEIDCFALNTHIKRGQCGVMQGNCVMQRGKPCGFHRTHEEYEKSCVKAQNRIRSLPETQRDYITQTYLTQKEDTK